MNKLLASVLCLAFSATASAQQVKDSVIVTGPNFQQLPIGTLPVTPTGGIQMTLSQALAFGANLTMPGPIGSVTPNTGAFKLLSVPGASPTAAGGSIFTITNTTQPVTGNALAFEIDDKASYAIPTFGGTTRPRIFETDLSVPTGVTSNTIHENFWSSNYLTGAGTSGVEINQFHAYFQNDMTGSVTGNVEGYESSALNNGAMGGYQDYLALFHNSAAATVTSVYGIKAQLTNDNAAAGSVGSWSGLDCESMIGSGSHPTFEYCLRNGNPQGAISTNGTVNIGSIAVSTIPLQVIGTDQSGATVTQKIIDGGGNRIFEVDNDGTLRTKGAGFTVDGSGNVTATLYKTGVTVGVSCAANTVSLTTLVVTNGIVTHC